MRDLAKLKADVQAKAQLAELEAKLAKEKTETKTKLHKEAAELQRAHRLKLQQSRDTPEEQRRAIQPDSQCKSLR